MEVIHNLGSITIRRNTNENAGFLLANKKGCYCSFFSGQKSRYFGLFYFDEKSMNMYKFIDRIEIAGNSEVTSLKSNFYCIERRNGNVIESFFMPRWHDSMVYELSSENEIDLILDCKNSLDNREWGRIYEISEEQGAIIIKFTKKTDSREDPSDGIEEFTLYLAVKSNKNIYEKNFNWVGTEYLADAERNSPPYKRHAFNAIKLRGSKFVFSMSKNKEDAVNECSNVFDNLDEIKSKEKECFFEILKNGKVGSIISNKKINNETKIAYAHALFSLSSLTVNCKNTYGIFAGYPWFFQFWSRDSLVSLKAVSKIDEKTAKRLLFKHLNNISINGRLPNLANGGEKDLESADSHGWLFLRSGELVKKIDANKEVINSIKKSVNLIRQNRLAGSEKVKSYLKNCTSIIKKRENEFHRVSYEIEGSLEKSLSGLLKHRTADGFEINGPKETWMDTDYENDCRKGIRVEIQALRLNMYKLMFHITQNHKYRVLENLLKARVKKNFWSGKVLADGLGDFTIRPNIFIAAYAYPELLSNSEWETCFENALKSLWLGWGGLTTIDKNSRLFTDTSTGENPKSYHHGDSWFWINNLAAIMLHKINKKKFAKEIKKIIEASTEEILWKGCVGCHSELSSAKELRSEGCFNQAWSNAMYVEMVDEIFG